MEGLWALGWAGLLLAAAWRWRHWLCPWPTLQGWCMGLLVARLLVGCLQALVWQQGWVSGGDSLMYYESLGIWWQLLGQDAGLAWQVLMVPHGSSAHAQLYDQLKQSLPILENHYALNLMRTLVPLYPLAGGSYYALAVICSAVGFAGSWAVYRVLQAQLAAPNLWLLLVVTGLPNTVFWTAGLLKEPIVWGCLGLVVWLVHKAMRRGIRWHTWVVLPLAFVVFSVKPYPLLALGLASACVGVARGFRYLWNLQRRMLAIAALGGCGVGLVMLGLAGLPLLWAHLTGSYEHLLVYGGGKQGSFFSVGWDGASWPSALLHAPQAAFAALYRPLLWEYPKWLGVVAGLDGALCLLLTCLLAWRVQWGLVPDLLLRHSWLGAMFVFVLVYAAFLGLSVPYWGTLVRMRVYVLPVWMAAWVLLAQLSKTSAQPKG